MKKILAITSFLLLVLLFAPFTYASSGGLSMTDGASIRTSGVQGLRFYGNLTNEEATGQGFYVIYGEASVGDLQDAISIAGEGEIILNGKKVFKVEVAETDENGNFSVVLTGIPEIGYLDKITAIAYAVVEDSEVFVDAGVTRSIGEVAYKMSQAGEYSEATNAILQHIDGQLRDLVETPWGTYEETSAVFVTDAFELREAFIADWNAQFGTTWTELTASTFAANARIGAAGLQGTSAELGTTRIYGFFNDPVMKERWEWLLDYIIAVDNIVHAGRQATAIKGDGTNGTFALYWADHLSYSLANFFNRQHLTGWSTAIDYTIPVGTARYRRVIEFNKKVVREADFDTLHKVGDIINLPQNLTKLGHTFDMEYKIGTTSYTATYTLTGEQAILVPQFTPIEYDITYYDGEDLVLPGATYNVTQTVTLPIYEKSGHVFEGCYDNPEFTGEPITSISLGSIGSKVLYARMIESALVPVDVTLNLNGGQLNSTDLYTLSDDAKHIEATRFSTAGDGAGARITVGTARGGLYWYVMGFKPTGVAGIYELVGKGAGYTNEEATLYVSYHDASTSPYKSVIASVYSSIQLGDLVVIEWLPPGVTADTSIDMYFVNASEATANVEINLVFETELLTPTRLGYTFAGWFDNLEFEGDPIFTYPGFTAADDVTEITYYAMWIED